MLLNPIKQVNLKCSSKQCGVLEITNKLCANKLGTFKPVDKHLTQKPPQIYKCCYNCLFQICSIPKWWNYIYSIACEKKRCLLQFIHQQLILYRESQRSWPTLKKLKVLYVECINALSNFSQKYMFIVFLNFPLIIKL